MEVDDTTYGEAAVVKIWFKNDDFGYAMNPKVIVEDSLLMKYIQRIIFLGDVMKLSCVMI